MNATLTVFFIPTAQTLFRTFLTVRYLDFLKELRVLLLGVISVRTVLIAKSLEDSDIIVTL